MTHAQAIEHLTLGRSVLVNINGVRTHISSIKELPSEAAMAKGDPDKEKAARLALVAERAKIDQQLKELGVDDSKTEEPESGTPSKRQTAAEKKKAEAEIAELRKRQEAGEELSDEEKARLAEAEPQS